MHDIRLRGPARRAQPWWLLLAALTFFWASPVVAQEGFSYAPPERAPKGERSRYIAEAADIVLEQIWTYLEEQGLIIESVNPQERIVIARYSGDPRPYVDCGVVTTIIDGKPADPPRRYSANKPLVRTGKTLGPRRFGLQRDLGLDARLVVRIEPRGKGARVHSGAVYVLTKTVSRLLKGNQVDAVMHREVISFTSAEVGEFDKGTRCVANSKLEVLPLDLFKKSS